MCEDLYVENYRIPEREIKDLNKWIDNVMDCKTQYW